MTELAAAGIPVTVTCRVLKLSRQPYYRWLANPITPSEVVEAYRANALFDAHRDDPEFGHRLLADEARDAGEAMSDRTAWRIASSNGWWSAFGKKRGRNGKKPGPPVHDDLCAVVDEDGRTRHVFAADAPNQLWLVDITEHKTAEGKLYCCAIKDACSGKIVGVLDRLEDEVPVGSSGARERCRDARRRRRLRGPQRQGQSISQSEVPACAGPSSPGRIHGPGRVERGQRGHGKLLRAAAEERPRPALLDHSRAAAHRDRHLDRTDLPPPTPSGTPGPFDAHRVRDHHEHDRRTGGVTRNRHLSVQQSRRRVLRRRSSLGCRRG